MSGLTVADLPIVNVRAVAFRYDRFTSIRDIKSVATTFGLVESGPSSSRSEGTKRKICVTSRPFDKPGLTKFSDDIVNLGHLVAARQAAIQRVFSASSETVQ
jgi:hypothetical protein